MPSLFQAPRKSGPLNWESANTKINREETGESTLWEPGAGQQMPDPEAAQNSQMPHPPDLQGGKCPAIARAGEGRWAKLQLTDALRVTFHTLPLFLNSNFALTLGYRKPTLNNWARDLEKYSRSNGNNAMERLERGPVDSKFKVLTARSQRLTPLVKWAIYWISLNFFASDTYYFPVFYLVVI